MSYDTPWMAGYIYQEGATHIHALGPSRPRRYYHDRPFRHQSNHPKGKHSSYLCNEDLALHTSPRAMSSNLKNLFPSGSPFPWLKSRSWTLSKSNTASSPAPPDTRPTPASEGKHSLYLYTTPSNPQTILHWSSASCTSYINTFTYILALQATSYAWKLSKHHLWSPRPRESIIFSLLRNFLGQK